MIIPILLLLLLGSRGAISEWIDVPQFSDRDKVYGPPISFRPQYPSDLYQRKLYQIRPHRDDYYDHNRDQVDFHTPTTEPNWRNMSKFEESHQFSTFDEDTKHTFVGTIASFTTERIISSIIEQDETRFESSDESTDEKNITPLNEPLEPEHIDEEFVTTPKLQDTTTEPPRTTTNKSQETNKTDKDQGFLDYLPIELLKKVHKTLKSQPPTLLGKIRFLKAFERTLVDEIQTRLSAALAPARVPRGARDHYDHYEHDDSIGFPSLEGTLMAISFLTFAVYLVRLVMLLFRNANNNVPPIFIGRKKRSIDDFHEEAARILGYLESSFPRQYIK